MGKSLKPVETCQCHLPGVHLDLRVLDAIANVSSGEVFDVHGCQAIILLGWREAKGIYISSLVFNIVRAFLFFLLALVSNDNEKYSSLLRIISDAQEKRYVYSLIIIALTSVEIAFEVLQAIGFTTAFAFKRYLTWANVGKSVTAVLTLAAAFLVTPGWNQSLGDLGVRLILGLVGFIRWCVILQTLTGFPGIGPKLLPITQALRSTGPFFLVVACPLLGFVHVYYAFGIKDCWQSFFLVFELGFLGEFDRKDLEWSDTESGHSIAGRTQLWAWIGLFVFFVGLIFTTVMMNILIGVLNQSYSSAISRQSQLFFQTRARIALNNRMMQIGMQKVRSPMRAAITSSSKLTRISSSDNISLLEEDRFVWYCRSKEGDTDEKRTMDCFAEQQLELRALGEQIADLRSDTESDRERMTKRVSDDPKSPKSDREQIRRLEDITSRLEGITCHSLSMTVNGCHQAPLALLT